MVAPPDNDVLWARGLTYAHDGSPALRGVSLGVREGEILAVTGPRGSGKTTLLRCLSGQLRAQRGEVWFNSVPVHTMGPLARERLRRDRFGWIDPEPVLVPELNVWENTALPLMLRGTGRRAAKAAALEWLERLDIRDTARRRPHTILQSERQRVVVARALVAAPTVLFADEPTAPLHRAEHAHVLRTLTTAARSHDITVVLATHDPETAALADRTLSLLDGRHVKTVHLPSATEGQGRPTTPGGGRPPAEGKNRRTTERAGLTTTERTGRPTAEEGGEPTAARGGEPTAPRRGRTTTDRPGRATTERASRSTTDEGGTPTTERPDRPAIERAGRPTTERPTRATAERAGRSTTDERGESADARGGRPAAEEGGEPTAARGGEPTAPRRGRTTTDRPGRATTERAGQPTTDEAGESADARGGRPAAEEGGEAAAARGGEPAADGARSSVVDGEDRAAADGEGRAACSLSA